MSVNVEAYAKKYAALLFVFSIPIKPIAASWSPGIGELLALFYLVFALAHRKFGLRKWVMLPVVIIGAGLLPAVLVAPSVTHAVGAYLQTIGYVFLGLALSSLFLLDISKSIVTREQAIRAAGMCLANYGMLISVALLLQVVTLELFSFDILIFLSGSNVSTESFAFGGTPRLTSIFPHSIHMGIALILPVYACIGILRSGQGGSRYVLVLLICLVGILFSGSRGALIFILPALVFMIKFSIKNIIYTLIIIVLSMPMVMNYGREHVARVVDTVTLSSTGDEASSNLQRLYLWQFALIGFAQKPIFGQGLGSYKALMSNDADALLEEYGIGEDNLTQYAGLAYEAGTVGLLTVFYLLFRPLSLRTLFGKVASLVWFIQAGFMAVILSNAFQNNLFTRGTWSVIWFSYGLLFAWSLIDLNRGKLP